MFRKKREPRMKTKIDSDGDEPMGGEICDRERRNHSGTPEKDEELTHGVNTDHSDYSSRNRNRRIVWFTIMKKSSCRC